MGWVNIYKRPLDQSRHELFINNIWIVNHTQFETKDAAIRYGHSSPWHRTYYMRTIEYDYLKYGFTYSENWNPSIKAILQKNTY